MNKKLTVSVIIPNYNGEKLLEKNLPSIIDTARNPENNITEIIVVDDASWDGSVKLLHSKFTEVKVIKHKVNRGFSASVNTGVRSSNGDLIVLLNTDVVPEKDFLVSAICDFEDSNLFAVSLHEKGYGPAKGSFSEGYIQLSPGEEKDKFQPSFYVSGGSGVFRREIWIALGGMDEKLLSPFYWEDIDLSYRATKRGYALGWEPKGIVYHKHESTISKLSKSYVQKVRERNQLLCIWKDITSTNLTRKHVVGLFTRLAKHPGYIRVVLMAIGRLGTLLKERKREVKESKISDEAIFAKY